LEYFHVFQHNSNFVRAGTPLLTFARDEFSARVGASLALGERTAAATVARDAEECMLPALLRAAPRAVARVLTRSAPAPDAAILGQLIRHPTRLGALRSALRAMRGSHVGLWGVALWVRAWESALRRAAEVASLGLPAMHVLEWCEEG
jgi:hypothetical protein